MKNILIYGHYNHNNVGDELFKKTFKNLFPEYNFTFTDNLNLKLLEEKDALFFGGGSFLDQPIEGFDNWEFKEYNKIPIIYIGVGLETEIHQNHSMFLTQAKLIASRTKSSIFDKSIFLNIPDLVYFQPKETIKNLIECKKYRKNDSVLILPNVSVLPTYDSPSWVTSTWENYKNQFAQFCDWLIDNNYKIDFYSMCQNATQHDNFVSNQIISMMKNRNYYLSGSIDKEWDESDIINYVNQFGSVITQRYHGIVLSQICNVPVLPIYHHDKLKVSNALPYYEISKHRLINAFNSLKQSNISIDYSAFDQLKQKVHDIVGS